MISIEIIEVRLHDVGTEAVGVSVGKTDHLPLFDRATAEHLMGGQPDKDVEAGLSELYDKTPRDPLMESGFQCLASLVSSRDETPPDLKGRLLGDQANSESPPIEDSALQNEGDTEHTASAIEDVERNPSGETLGCYLGSGSFSHVFSVKTSGTTSVGRADPSSDGPSGRDMDVIVKVPRSYASEKGLSDELRLLKALQEDVPEEIRSTIPAPYVHQEETELQQLELKRGCEHSVINCLKLRSRIGKTAKAQMLSVASKQHRVAVLESVATAITKVFKYIHNRKPAVFHLDVKPSNIIVVDIDENGKFFVQLIDWDCAATQGQKIRGYRGCPPYSHRTLLTNEPGATWTPEAKYDKASLAFTIACLAKNEVGVPWHGFQDLSPSADALSGREELASKLIRRTRLDKKVKGELIKSIQLPSIPPVMASPRNADQANKAGRAGEGTGPEDQLLKRKLGGAEKGATRKNRRTNGK